MQDFTCSSNPDSALNEARLQLWCSKVLLSDANKLNDNAMKGRAMRLINKDRQALAEVAHAVRAKLPPKKTYGVTLAASTMTVETKVMANNKRDALNIARFDYGDSFSVARVEEIK